MNYGCHSYFANKEAEAQICMIGEKLAFLVSFLLYHNELYTVLHILEGISIYTFDFGPFPPSLK